MKKYENFKAALNNLKDIYDYEEPYSNVEQLELSVYMKFALNRRGKQ